MRRFFSFPAWSRIISNRFSSRTMIDHLQYSVGVPAEDLSKYCPGGYHPIHIGDVFQDGRYTIVQKLGFGGFSTVWLARDNLYAIILLTTYSSWSVPDWSSRKQSNVSIKVVVSDHSESHSRELGILQHLKEKGDSNHPGCQYVSQLLDSFHHEGPNGRHLCVVMEVLGPEIPAVMDKCTNYRLNGHLAHRVSSQLLLAVDYLHSCGVAHGGTFLIREWSPWSRPVHLISLLQISTWEMFCLDYPSQNVHLAIFQSVSVAHC